MFLSSKASSFERGDREGCHLTPLIHKCLIVKSRVSIFTAAIFLFYALEVEIATLNSARLSHM